MTEKLSLPETGFIRLTTILKFIPIGRSTFWYKVQIGEYPKPIKLGPKTTAWKAEDIHQLIQKFQNSN